MLAILNLLGMGGGDTRKKVTVQGRFTQTLTVQGRIV